MRVSKRRQNVCTCAADPIMQLSVLSGHTRATREEGEGEELLQPGRRPHHCAHPPQPILTLLRRQEVTPAHNRQALQVTVVSQITSHSGWTLWGYFVIRHRSLKPLPLCIIFMRAHVTRRGEDTFVSQSSAVTQTHLMTLQSLQVRCSWVRSRHSTLSISCSGTWGETQQSSRSVMFREQNCELTWCIEDWIMLKFLLKVQ